MSSDVVHTDQAQFDELGKFIDEMGLGDDSEVRQAALIEVLHRAQHIFGYLPESVQEFVAEKLKLSLAQIYGVITFYHYFTTTPRGKYEISICLGTACFVRGADKIIAEFEKTLNINIGEVTPCGTFSLSMLRCVGACSLSPVLMVEGKTYGNVTTEQVAGILAEYDEEYSPEPSQNTENQ